MNQISDFELQAKIKIALILNSHIGGLEIGVECVNGIVFLTGKVQDEEQKIIAENIAKENGGIDIKNDIKYLSVSQEDDEIEEDTTKEEDMIILQRAQGILENDSRVNSFLINVESKNGTVRISGLQASVAAKDRAVELISGIQGVKTVIDDIKLEDAA